MDPVKKVLAPGEPVELVADLGLAIPGAFELENIGEFHAIATPRETASANPRELSGNYLDKVGRIRSSRTYELAAGEFLYVRSPRGTTLQITDA